MSLKEELIDKLYQVVNIMSCESKIARSFGTAHKLTHSDICLLKCIQHNENAKASELSGYLGITNGAITQLAKKMEGKGYLQSYRIADNRKEIYYRLTASGEAACRGHNEYYRKKRECLEAYVNSLEDDIIVKIIGLLDAAADSYVLGWNCYMRHTADKNSQTAETEIRRCEKCKRVY